MAVPSSSHQSPKSEASSRKQKDESKNQREEGDGGGDGLKDAKRNNNPGVRVVGGRIYCPFNGKTCHQCRQKTLDFTAACRIMKGDKQCTIKFCHKCLLNRYGEKAEDVAALENWKCPKCRGICNCSFCMKKRGHKPTGILVHTAKKTGFSSVSEMLSVGGPESLDLNKPAKPADVSSKNSDSDENLAVLSPRKQGKENSSDHKIDLNLKLDSSTANSVKKSSKKRKPDGLNETCDTNVDDESIPKDRTRKKPGDSEKVSDREAQRNKKNKRVIKARKNMVVDVSRGISSGLVNEEKPNMRQDASGSPAARAYQAAVKSKFTADPVKVNGRSAILQNKELHADIPLPEGILLTGVAGVELPSEVIGDALQFLEFCAAFGKVLDIRKGEAESIIRELTCGRRRRHGQASLIVRFHIQLISLILKDMGDENLRGWIEDQNLRYVENGKEARGKLLEVKEKEKLLKQKMKNDVTEVIIAKNGVPLSVSEHDAIVSQVKHEIAQVHAEMLEMSRISKKQQRSDAVRTEPVIVDGYGRTFWKLKGYKGEPDVLLQGWFQHVIRLDQKKNGSSLMLKRNKKLTDTSLHW
ncbi:uncharacterized protein LOC115734953 isoform X2 [Rhodamnia argentea]|uniref:Uncharacterized protein LOC115734953 isoform X2 n=1 Tax=Rhodamnia argentea TaxID=178133 RepID=A0ABM3HQV5_9MYRT|nr:uncharacterized protein LOC115734953 isoform X2 [Rhodamnia argentea]